MIYTSYFAQMRNFPENYIPVAICGGVPDWYKGLWYRKLAPKLAFFQEWKRNGDNAYYIKHYNAEVLDTLEVNKVLNDLQLLIPEETRAAMHGPVWAEPDIHLVLLCYEKVGDFCHRHLFADWLCENGIPVRELRKEDIQK